MKKQLISIDLNDFPKELHSYFKGATVYDSSCYSSAIVYYLDTGYYLKVDEVGRLYEEAKLNRLFYNSGFGVEVISYISLDKDYLLTRSAIGNDCTHFLDTPEKLCQVMANTLLKLHSSSWDGFPISSRMQRFGEAARGDISSGEFDSHVLLRCFQINSLEEAWDIMQENVDKLKFDTLIHGDYCLPNIILNDGKFSSLIDFNMSGVGDKHIDLYWAIWSLEYNLKSDKYTDYFLDLYGRDNFDYDMLRVIAAFEVFG